MPDIKAKTKQISGRVMEVKSKLSFTKIAFARVAMASRPHLDKVLEGAKLPTTEHVLNLIEEGIDPTWLLTGQGKMFLPWKEKQRIIMEENKRK